MLGEIVPAEGDQLDLFSQMQTNPKSSALMSTMDKINRKMCKESIKLASEGFKRPWKMNQEKKPQAIQQNGKKFLKLLNATSYVKGYSCVLLEMYYGLF